MKECPFCNGNNVEDIGGDFCCEDCGASWEVIKKEVKVIQCPQPILIEDIKRKK